MKKFILILGLFAGFILTTYGQVETYPSLGYFPDAKVAVDYEVQAKDNLGKIAKQFKTSVDAIKKANFSLAMTDNLKVGDIIKVHPPQVAGLKAPEGTVQYVSNESSTGTNNQASGSGNGGTKKEAKFIDYKVQQGDTLYSLGKKFNVNPEQIRRANMVLAMTDHVEPGQVIKIPVVENK